MRTGSAKDEERKGGIQTEERESEPTTLGFFHRDHPELAGARASVGKCEEGLVSDRDLCQPNNSEQSCSNLSVVAPGVARLNSNGLMSLLTRTERSVSFRVAFPPLNIPRPYRTTSATVSMPPPAGGRKIRMFIGTIAIAIYHKKSVQKKSVKSRKQRQKHSPLRCMPRSLSISPFLDIHSHTVVLGHQRRNHRQAHKAWAQMRYPSSPQQLRVVT
jgi:hypothetical protein